MQPLWLRQMSSARSVGQGKGFNNYKYVLDRDSVSLSSVLAERDVFLVNFELSAVSCENNQLVSSSKFKLVCQVVNAKKPKKSRVTHLQLKGVIELYY